MGVVFPWARLWVWWVSFGAGVGMGVCERAGVGGRRVVGGRVGAGVHALRRRSGCGCGCVCVKAGMAVGTGVGASRRGSGFWRVGGVWREGPSFLFFFLVFSLLVFSF